MRGVVQVVLLGAVIKARGLELWPSHVNRTTRTFILVQVKRWLGQKKSATECHYSLLLWLLENKKGGEAPMRPSL